MSSFEVEALRFNSTQPDHFICYQSHTTFTIFIYEIGTLSVFLQPTTSGGGQPPTPTVPSVRHAGPVEVAERDAPVQSSVQEGGGAEATALGSRGGEGGHL